MIRAIGSVITLVVALPFAMAGATWAARGYSWLFWWVVDNLGTEWR